LLGPATGVPLGIGQGEQKHFAGDELITPFERFFFGGLQQPDQLWPGLHLLLPMDLRQTGDGGLGGGQQCRHLGASTLQQGFGAVGLPEHGDQQMGHFDVGVIAPQRERLGIGQGFLEFGGQFVKTHDGSAFLWARRWRAIAESVASSRLFFKSCQRTPGAAQPTQWATRLLPLTVRMRTRSPTRNVSPSLTCCT
jgi:hypothetical protein